MRPSSVVASLRHDQRPAAPDPHQEAGIELLRLDAADAAFDRDARVREAAEAAAADPRIGILGRRDHAQRCRPRSGLRCRAASGPGGCRARAKHRRWRRARPRRRGAALRSRHAAGRPAGSSRGRRRGTAAVVAHDHAADRRIGPNVAEPAPRQRRARCRMKRRVVGGQSSSTLSSSADEVFEIFRLAEIAVDRREADIGDLVERMQRFHDQAADHARP